MRCCCSTYYPLVVCCLGSEDSCWLISQGKLSKTKNFYHSQVWPIAHATHVRTAVVMHRWVAASKRGGDVVVDPRTHSLSLCRNHRRTLWSHAPATRLPAIGLLRVLLMSRLHRRRLIVHARSRLLVHIARTVAPADVASVPIVSHCRMERKWA